MVSHTINFVFINISPMQNFYFMHKRLENMNNSIFSQTMRLNWNLINYVIYFMQTGSIRNVSSLNYIFRFKYELYICKQLVETFVGTGSPLLSKFPIHISKIDKLY